jgi:hypothetical protein
MSLRKALTRLAHEKPELRADLLPLLQGSKGKKGAFRNRAPRDLIREEPEDEPILIEMWDDIADELPRDQRIDGDASWYFHHKGFLYGPFPTEIDTEDVLEDMGIW